MPEFTAFIAHVALARDVLAVATTRIDGTWTAYCGAVPGKSHVKERDVILADGDKLSTHVARAIFGHYDAFSPDVPYSF